MEMSLLARCKSYFGLKLGQTLTEFAVELKQLTDKDKDDLVKWFNEAGMSTVLVK